MGPNSTRKMKMTLTAWLVGLCVVAIPFGSTADEGHELTVDDIVSFKSFDVKPPVHKVFVLIRKDGHSMNRPFVIEVRPTCAPQISEEWAKFEVRDGSSVCGMDPKSLKYDSKANEIKIDYVEPDVAFYQSQIDSKVKKIKQRCLKERKTMSFSIAQLCAKP